MGDHALTRRQLCGALRLLLLGEELDPDRARDARERLGGQGVERRVAREEPCDVHRPRV